MEVKTLGFIVRVDIGYIVVYVVDELLGSHMHVLDVKDIKLYSDFSRYEAVGFVFDITGDRINNWHITEATDIADMIEIKSLNVDGTLEGVDNNTYAIFKNAEIFARYDTNTPIYESVLSYIKTAKPGEVLMGIMHNGVCYSTAVCTVGEVAGTIVDKLLKAATLSSVGGIK